MSEKSEIDETYIHETTDVEANVSIGEGTKIWHYSHVLSNSEIGKLCSIGRNVSIGPDVKIGNKVKIQNNVSVYSGVIIEDEVFCGPSCVFTNITNPRAFINRKSEFKKTLLKRGCSIGANATILCGITIGEYALVAAGATVTKSIPAYALVAGTPARRIGWVSKLGYTLDNELICPGDGSQYYLKSANELECI